MSVIYRIKSGTVDVKHETVFDADPRAIVYCAMELASRKGKEHTCGALIELSGGKFVGDEAIYFDAVTVLRDLGRMKE